MAGVNAVLQRRGEDPFVLDRADAYIGVLIDDLVTKGTDEPYRIFTSRAEYRLQLREDNADMRLMAFGRDHGLVSDESWQRFLDKQLQTEAELKRLESQRLAPGTAVDDMLRQRGSTPLRESASLVELLRRPELRYEDVVELAPPPTRLTADAGEHIEATVKYAGYVERQADDIARLKRLEAHRIPVDFDYDAEAQPLSTEARQKLTSLQPATVGQAARVSGVSPADISALMVLLHARGQRQTPAN